MVAEGHGRTLASFLIRVDLGKRLRSALTRLLYLLARLVSRHLPRTVTIDRAILQPSSPIAFSNHAFPPTARHPLKIRGNLPGPRRGGEQKFSVLAPGIPTLEVYTRAGAT